MKIKIGPYLNYWGPYQLADLLLYWNYIPNCFEGRVADYIIDHFRISKDRCYKIGEWLADTRLSDICQWIHDRRRRTVKVRIDRFDTWGMYHTLALLILPMLRQLKETKHGSPLVDPEDVPEDIRPTEEPSAKNGYVDNTIHERWAWVLDEMIWTFEQLVNDDHEAQFFDHSQVDKNASFTDQLAKVKCDYEALTAHNDRIHRGTTLFGKYFQGLWD